MMMNRAARTFWSMYYANVLTREKLISPDEFAEIIRNKENLPLYNQRVTEYNYFVTTKNE